MNQGDIVHYRTEAGELVVGIDLGTTNSAIAVFQGGHPVTVANSHDDNFTPSYVSYRNNNQCEVGLTAKINAYLYPANTIYGVKRIIGRKYSDLSEPKMASIVSDWRFEIVDQDGVPAISLVQDGQVVLKTPEMVAAEILRTLKEDAEYRLGVPISKAVISVPANYNSFQRDLTKKAGSLAGLEVLQVISEPSAAALAYGIKDNGRDVGYRQMLVFDFGGGTLDVSVLKADGRTKFEIIATAGDMQLGGEDFDSILAEHMTRHFEDAYGRGIRQDDRARTLLKQNAEEVKRHLSAADESYTIFIPDLYQSHSLKMTITREEFERLCAPLFDRILIPVRAIMNENPEIAGAITDVIMVGGSSNIPRVQKLLREYFPGVPIRKDIPPEEAISHGAAVYADVLTNPVSEIEVADYVHQAFGIENYTGDMVVVIPKKSLLPTKKFLKKFHNARDNQTEIDFPVYQGNKKIAKNNSFLGHILVSGLPRRKRGENLVDITMWVDENQILQVTTHSMDTGEKLEAKFCIISRQQSGSAAAVAATTF